MLVTPGSERVKNFHKSKVTEVAQRQKLVAFGTWDLLEHSPETSIHEQSSNTILLN